jgi:hypothetical protein
VARPPASLLDGVALGGMGLRCTVPFSPSHFLCHPYPLTSPHPNLHLLLRVPVVRAHLLQTGHTLLARVCLNPRRSITSSLVCSDSRFHYTNFLIHRSFIFLYVLHLLTHPPSHNRLRLRPTTTPRRPVRPTPPQPRSPAWSPTPTPTLGSP